MTTQGLQFRDVFGTELQFQTLNITAVTDGWEFGHMVDQQSSEDQYLLDRSASHTFNPAALQPNLPSWS